MVDSFSRGTRMNRAARTVRLASSLSGEPFRNSRASATMAAAPRDPRPELSRAAMIGARAAGAQLHRPPPGGCCEAPRSARGHALASRQRLPGPGVGPGSGSAGYVASSASESGRLGGRATAGCQMVRIEPPEAVAGRPGRKNDKRSVAEHHAGAPGCGPSASR